MTDDESLFRARAPRLTRLEIQGFKSFLHRTVFAFEPGITAIVGPNGSGKSNVADAVRWVLGEQGQQALRARKTEDVIFNGAQGRAPAGMAEATLTFDNSDGWLPSEFAEVTVTRRAFRSGENHYLINGRRVRLKDVAFLTASLGQSHVVVGQGLVDAALSLRAEERRGLFEHAADLTGLRLKVAEAERNLTETEANTARLNDLLLELEPRLKNLERAARQAREWQGLRDRLRSLQSAHYREALVTARATLAAAQSEADAARSATQAARTEAQRFADAEERTAGRLAAARERLAAHDERRAGLEDRLRRQTHERDLAAARLESLAKRRADMADARAGLDERVASVAADLDRLQSELRELERVTAEARETSARHRRDLAAHRAARGEIDQRVAAASRCLSEGERRETELLRQRAVLTERAESLRGESERLKGAIGESAARIASLESDLLRAAAASAEDDERATSVERQLAELTVALESATTDATSRRTERDQLERELAEAATRLEVLQRLQASGAELHAGVRAVLAASQDGRLGGVLGTVAERLVVPPAIETAIEVALGGRLQDVMVASWADAEAAIALLKETGAGRATFQPLDSVRGSCADMPATIAGLPGVHGLAASLVTAQGDVAPVIDALLGRTIVVADLATARAVLLSLPAGWSVVTLPGDLARSGGSVAGGAVIREGGTLGRERELRELPGAVANLETGLAAARERVATADAAVRSLIEDQRQAAGEHVALRAAAVERGRERDRLHGWLAEQRAEHERTERRRDSLRDEQERAADGLLEIDEEIERVQAERVQAAQARDEAAASLAELSEAAAAAERAEAAEGRRLAGLEERVRGECRREAGLRAQERALAEELALRVERTAALDRERQTLGADHERLVAEAAASADELTALAAEREPLRMETMGAEIAAGRLAESLQAARIALGERERASDQAGFALERAAQELESVRRRIVEALDVADPDDLLAAETEVPEGVAADREAEIGRLRERLRRVGYVGEDAVAEYEREATQQAFLREQVGDVEGAAAALRDLLADLRQTMRTRFDETFAQVAAAFAEAFAVLFGGGTARLVLTGGENGSEPGIDIVAQPPGKRLQNLALLSGGERALTAAALLFAILKVSPAPFCLLDEVDAALDEANVVRFRDRLQELAAQTQVIVVTHNRGTIEIADTLYGVSMGADGVSQVLSLRLTESLPAD